MMTPDNQAGDSPAVASGSTSPIRVFLADDHAMFRQGLAMVLASAPDMELVGQCGIGDQVIREVIECSPDILIQDITMPGRNGLEICREMAADHAEVAVLMLSIHNNEQMISAAITSGASGYLLKDAATEELLHAIREVARGRFYLGDGISRNVMKRIGRDAPDTLDKLSDRERQVLEESVLGKTNQEIGDTLSMGAKTVDTHRRRLMKKLGLASTIDLLKYAIKHGISRL